MAVAVRWFNPGPKVYWRGRWFDKAMVIAVTDVERVQGFKEYFYQGSYNRGVGASAGTHNRGAVMDRKERGLSNRQSYARRGIVGWHRTRKQGFMDHNHAILMWSKTAAPGLKAQMYAFRNGKNGLAGNGRDDSGVRTVYRHYLDWQKTKNTASKKPVQKKTSPPPVAYLTAIETSRRYGKKVRPYYSVKLLQRALNRVYAGTPLKEDGIFGPATATLYNRWRRAQFGAGPQSAGKVGAQGLKLLFKRAKLRANVMDKGGGRIL
jgi:hypothetical protein